MKKALIRNYIMSNVMIVIGTSLFNPVLYLFLEQSNFSYTDISLYLSIFWLVTFISELPCGFVCDFIGHRESMICSCLLRFIGLIILVLSRSLYLLIISAILTGIAESLLSGTLVSWFVNESHLHNIDINEQVVFSKASFISSFFSMLVGFLSAQILYNIHISVPVSISSIVFLSVTFYFLFLFPKTKKKHKEQKNYLEDLNQMTSEVLRFFKNNPEIIVSFLLLFIPSLLDLGPSNQWPSVLNSTSAVYINGYMWIMIMGISMLANFVIAKFEKVDLMPHFRKFIIIDIICISIMSISHFFIIGFILHVFFFAVCSIISRVYMHRKLIQNDRIRTTIVSCCNTFESLLITLLLPVNGILSDAIGITQTWIVFSVLGIFILFLSSAGHAVN